MQIAETVERAYPALCMDDCTGRHITASGTWNFPSISTEDDDVVSRAGDPFWKPPVSVDVRRVCRQIA